MCSDGAACFQGSGDELWMLAQACGCRFRVYQRAHGGYKLLMLIGTTGPVVRRMVWIPSEYPNGDSHYNVLLSRTATSTAVGGCGNGLLSSDADLRRRMQRTADGKSRMA